VNKIIRWFFILLVTVVFIIIFANAFTVSQKAKREKEQLFKAAKTAVVNYLHIPTTSPIIFTSNPISYSENGCVVGCYIDLRNASGVKRRTWLDVLLQREGPGRGWTGTIIKYTPDQPIVSKNLKPAPWDLFKSSKKDKER
jgi:hypothetical protein